MHYSPYLFLLPEALDLGWPWGVYFVVGWSYSWVIERMVVLTCKYKTVFDDSILDKYPWYLDWTDVAEVQSGVQSTDGDKEKWVMHSRILTAERGIQGDIHGNMECAKTENVFFNRKMTKNWERNRAGDAWQMEGHNVCLQSLTSHFHVLSNRIKNGSFPESLRMREKKCHLDLDTYIFLFHIKMRSCRLIFPYSFRSSSFLSLKASCNMAN